MSQVAGWESDDQGLTPRWGYKKYVDNDTCIRQLRSRDRELVSPDKFCLEEAKGTFTQLVINPGK